MLKLGIDKKKMEFSIGSEIYDPSQPDDILQKIEMIKQKINEKLSKFYHNRTHHLALTEFVGKAHKILMSPDAKRIRAIIPILIGETLSLEPETCLLNGVVIELLHFTSLIHDDIIDNHRYRRGYPTLNHTFARNHAVLIGDYMMCEVINYGLSSKSSTKVVELLVDAVKKLVTGVIMEQNVLPENPSLENYSEMVYYKTGSLFSLSFALPFVADSRFSTAMSCGKQFGYLFQIYDDLLDRDIDKPYENIFHIMPGAEISKLWLKNYAELLETSQQVGISQVVLDMVKYLQSYGYFLDIKET